MLTPKVLVLFGAFAVSCLAAAPGSRIINGYDAEEGQIPYQILLSIAGNPICGGVILNERFVLTAAQCVVTSGSNVMTPVVFSIKVGSISRFQGYDVRLKSIKIDSRYFRPEIYHDIAILEVETPLVYSKTVQPIEMSDKNVPVGAQVQISGWGKLSLDSNIPTLNLQYYDGETVLSQEECAELVGVTGDTIMCLGHRKKRGACIGDFGGPAVYDGKLVGVGSFSGNGTHCGTELPDGYTRVVPYYQWILDNIQ